MTDSKLSIDEVLDLVMLEEDEPSQAALLRWVERYPDYQAALTDFFATWTMQELHAKYAEPTKIDEEKLIQRGVDYAMEILRKQGRVVPAGTVESLSPFDQMVLAAAHALQGQGWAVNITEEVSKMRGTQVLLGSTFASLDSLEERGLVLARREKENPKRRYYTMTVVGDNSLAYAKAHSKVIADFLGDFA